MASSVSYDDGYETGSELGVDSDVESHFDTSLTDGDSERRACMRSLPADGSSGSREPGTKAQELSERSNISSSSSVVMQSVWSAVEEPLSSNTEPPPPNYEAATASRPFRHPLYHVPLHVDACPPQSTATGHPHQAPPIWAPQSMSDAARTRRHPPDEETGLLTGVTGALRKRNGLFCFKKFSICNVLLVTMVVVLVLLAFGGSAIASENGSDADSGKGGNDNVAPTDHPSPNLPPDTPTIPSSPQCPYEYYSETTTFSFISIRNFSFVELMESSDWILGGINGTVNVQPGRQDQSEDVRLSLTYATTKPWMWLASNLVKSEDSLMLQLPNLKKTKKGSSAKPCMWVYVKIEVRAGVRLDDWELVTGNLDINVEDGLFSSDEGTDDLSVLEIGRSSTLNAIRGNVEVVYWSSRETRIVVISGSIKGDFALRDLLSLKSQSGSIDVGVTPKEADSDHAKPAEYVAQSRSGSIKTRFPSSGDIPAREYITRLDGQSSSISGSYILGSLSSFRTASGSIVLDLLPKFDHHQPANLHTDTRSGHTKLRVLTPDNRPGEPWSHSHTSHKTTSTSGSIDIVYPQEWSGLIEGESISGSIEVKGKDVEIVSDEHRGPVFRHLVARKGIDGHGSVGLKSTSGSIEVRVGEL